MKILVLFAVFALTGCAIKNHVFVDTETVLGISVAQGADGIPEARLGYARVEVALAPTNSDVLTEFSFKNAFSFTSGPSLYQRMAVGSNAVQNSQMMFIKNPDGTFPEQADAILKALKSNKTDR